MKAILGTVLVAVTWFWSALVLAGKALEIEEPYAPAVIPGQANGTAYMRLLNPGSVPRTLVGAKSDAAAAVELHSHGMQDGMMTMRRVQRIEVPPQSSLTLEPGGLHLMLIGLTRDLAAGDSFELALDLEDGTSVVVRVPVREGPVAEPHHP